MPEQLSNAVQPQRVMNAVAAGTSDQVSSVVDTQGYEGVLFIALFGALTATQVTKVKAQQGALANGSDLADLEGSATSALADGDGNKALVVDVYKPRERYVALVVDRGTANAVIDGVIAIPYGPRSKPTSLHATVKQLKQLVSPAEGTA